MSHLYDTIEPNVISESLLRECVSEQGPSGEVGKVANSEGIDFTEVVQLRLDFKNILRIENLWQFKNLRKLQLDNNIIEDVYGLEMLTQLEWLDLSFNNIEVIRGLGKLVCLKDLSLANNRIQCIENMDSLRESLQVLSLANNLIEDRDHAKYLRGFSKLQTLALKGNPFSSEDQYRSFLVAYIPSLHYLDFRIIMEDERKVSCEMFEDMLSEVEFQEREMLRKKEAERAAMKKEQLLTCAYVNGFEGSMLFASMFIEDHDAEKINLLPDVPHMLKKLEEEFATLCEHLVKIGLEQNEKRIKDHAAFVVAHTESCQTNQEWSVERIKHYEEIKQKILSKDRKVEEIKDHLDHLQKKLMWGEIQLVEQLDEISKDFELNYGDMVGSFRESVQLHMTQLRDLENKHHEKVTEIALSLLEQLTKGQLQVDIPDDLKSLFIDKDTLVSALNTSHDTHLLAIDNREDDISQRANKDAAKIFEDIQAREMTRNRKKIAEIDHYITKQHKELASREARGIS